MNIFYKTMPICVTRFMLLCWNNPSLKGQMLHSEGNIQHIVYQSKGSITTDIICNRV